MLFGCRGDFNYRSGKQLRKIRATYFPLTIQNSFLIAGRVSSRSQ